MVRRLYSTNLPNLDGLNEVNNEYNLDIPLNLPAGKHLIEITNTGPAVGFISTGCGSNRCCRQPTPGNWQPAPGCHRLARAAGIVALCGGAVGFLLRQFHQRGFAPATRTKRDADQLAAREIFGRLV